ncbi:MAG: hypothetical protein PHN38_04865 [Sulfurospirillaceae bacterium]|nr:hypothetical protein [Sulfurospirillaceae bacterium]
MQTKGATYLKKDYQKIQELLLKYKEKLDLRNPNNYDKKENYMLQEQIKSGKSNLNYIYNGKKLKAYDEYFKVAFDKSPLVPYRNDFLIMGLHKLIVQTYNANEGHKISTIGYDVKHFNKLYYYLYALRWKIRTAQDTSGNYLFLTWQNNWQVELQKRLKETPSPTWQTLQELEYIKNNKESIFGPSNFNFEILITQMIEHVKNSAKVIGDEPVDLSIDALVSIVLFL